MDSSTYEVTLENMIMDNLDYVQSRNFPYLYKNTQRQCTLPSGGVCDVLSYEVSEKTFSCKIFELKRNELNISSLIQVLSYGECLAKCTAWHFDEVNIELYLVGADISNDLFSLAAWGLNVNIVLFDYRVDGVYFDAFKPLGKFPKPYWITNHTEMSEPTSEYQTKAFLESLSAPPEQKKRIEELEKQLK